jgi:hypothetical protein
VLNLLPFDTIAGLLTNIVLKENIAQVQLLPSEIEIKLRRDSNRSKYIQLIIIFVYNNN